MLWNLVPEAVLACRSRSAVNRQAGTAQRRHAGPDRMAGLVERLIPPQLLVLPESLGDPFLAPSLAANLTRVRLSRANVASICSNGSDRGCHFFKLVRSVATAARTGP